MKRTITIVLFALAVAIAISCASAPKSIPPPAPPPLPPTPVVTPPSDTQTPGTWANVTPSAVDLVLARFSNDNYGVQDVVVDPARPSDLYAFVCHQGVWKSTDFGRTWKGPINTGPGGQLVTAGKPWTAAIAHATDAGSPTLWTAAGNAQVGVLKSTDGGVSWTAYRTHNAQAEATFTRGGDDVYSLDVDPHDPQHLIAGFHEAPGLSESTDGGVTWRDVAAPAAAKKSLYPFFLTTGAPATTAATWLAIAQIDGGASGTWRTADRGATWAQVENFEHTHGGAQISQVDGYVYAGGIYGTQNRWGIFRSGDQGTTWSYASNGGAAQGGVVATATRLYATLAATPGQPGLQTASRSTGLQWSRAATPAGLTDGFKRAAATYDGQHWIVVGGAWNAGIWRFVESP
jgi:hypothetical protein